MQKFYLSLPDLAVFYDAQRNVKKSSKYRPMLNTIIFKMQDKAKSKENFHKNVLGGKEFYQLKRILPTLH